MVAHDLPDPGAGLEALTCWWARGERKKQRKKKLDPGRQAKIYKLQLRELTKSVGVLTVKWELILNPLWDSHTLSAFWKWRS